MKIKLCLLLLFTLSLSVSYAANKIIKKPYVEGKGMKGWVIDSIQITAKNTTVYGHFGLGKGDYAAGNIDSYLEIPNTGKRLKQTDLKGELPRYPDKIIGEGRQHSFIYVFPAIPADTKVINITSDDFDGTGAAWYGVWLVPRTTIFTEKLDQIPDLEGNWFANDGSGEWKAGFYEKKIFWQNQFWDYSITNITDSSINLSLIIPPKNIHISYIKNKTITISKIDTGKIQIVDNARTCDLTKKAIYNTPDMSEFKPDFYLNDSITVIGYYRVANPVFSNKAALIASDFFSGTPRIYPLKIGKDGVFSAKIPLEHSMPVTFSNQLGTRSPLSEVTFMAEPGDSIILTYRNEDEKNVIFGGKNQRFNNEQTTFSNINSCFVNKKKAQNRIRTNVGNFAEWRKTEQEKLKTALSVWQSTHTTNKKLDAYVWDNIKYGYVGDILLAALQSKNDSMVVDILPPATDTVFYNNPEVLYSDDYRYFLNRLNALQNSTQNIQMSDICNYLLENIPHSDEEKEILGSLIDKQSLLSTKEGIEEYKKYMDENKERINSLFAEDQLFVNEFFEKQRIERQKKYPIADGQAKNYITTINYARILAKGERTLTSQELQKFDEDCKDISIKDYIFNKNKNVQAQLQNIFEDELPADIKIESVPENEKDITKAIVDKFKGKVIYLDFWATWCAPCRAMMPYSKNQKEKLKEKNIVFVYITGDSSPEVTWRKMIRDIPGNHIKLTKEQWTSILEKYNIKGIPHYILIDKKGKVADINAPRPNSDKEFTAKIEKLL
ncbi:MAG: TlpA family protein disulfide reductase [Paludibacteraceae bacterium]